MPKSTSKVEKLKGKKFRHERVNLKKDFALVFGVVGNPCYG